MRYATERFVVNNLSMLPPPKVRQVEDPRPVLAPTLAAVRNRWKSLMLADLAYKLVALVLLTPLVGILLSVMVAFSGQLFLADEDILRFFLGPIGWVCFVFIGALSLGILAVEQVALMAIVAARAQDRELSALQAMKFAASQAAPTLRIATRIAAICLVIVAPFVAMAGLVYTLLLSKYDINYYLSHKPPAFLAAIGLGTVIGGSLFALLILLATSWFCALPLVVFESVRPADALNVSRQRAHGRRRKLLFWILAWLIGTGLLSAAASGLVVILGRVVIPTGTESIELLLLVLGGLVSLWGGVGLICSLLSTILLAALLFQLYDQARALNSDKRLILTSASSPRLASRFKWTRGRVIAGAVMGIAIAVVTGVIAIQDVRLHDEVEITAHRGASAHAPDNTLAAVQKAIEVGADWVEIDVQETADGEVVVFHDSDFKKVAGHDLKIWEASRADIEQLDVGSWFAPEFRDERVPTLSQILEMCRGKIRVNIELKYYGHSVQLEQRVIDIVESHGMAADIVIMSLKQEGIRRVKSLRPNWRVGLLTAAKIGDLTRSDADFLAVNAQLATRSLIQAAHAKGQDIHVWTVNDAVTMSLMMGRGVDNIITDEPELGLSILRQRATLSVPERLLLEVAGILGAQPQLGEP